MKRKPLNVSNRWTRWAVAVLGVALFAAPGVAHAQGVTNPAQHPAPIKVTVDGQTYHDGQDTLPGYDDEACTPIPNVQYDFADNQIQYYSGDGELIATANWTEWARISSYDTWKAQQQSGAPSSTSTPTPSATTPASTAPAPSNSSATTAPATTKPAATTSPSTTTTTNKGTSTKSSTTKSSSTKSSSTSSPSTTSSSSTSSATKTPSSGSTASSTSTPTTSSSAATSDTASQDSTVTNDAATAATPAADGTTETTTATTDPAASGVSVTGAANPAPTPGTEPVPSTSGTEPATKFKLASEHLGPTGGVGDNRLAGVGILAALFGLAGFGLMFRGVARRQGFGPGSQW